MFPNGFEILKFVVDEFAGDSPKNIRSQRIESKDAVTEFAEAGNKLRHPELVVEPLDGGGNFAFHAQVSVPLKNLRADVRGKEEQEPGNIVGLYALFFFTYKMSKSGIA